MHPNSVLERIVCKTFIGDPSLMPLEAWPAGPKSIAVIGAGISGMGAAHMLSSENRVVLFESEGRLGGHARTKMAGPDRADAVDTGFIVFNYANYPHLTALFDELDVPVRKSNMSFGVSADGGRVEYALSSLDALFAQRKHLVSPRYLRMVRDILHFNANALEASKEEGLTIGGLLNKLGTGSYFRDYYLLPFSGAIWSTPVEKILEFPAQAMMRFFDNHALLQASGQHQWFTVEGGSQSYVTRLDQSMRQRGVEIRLGASVQSVRRTLGGVEIKTAAGEWESFDQVVFATHSDITLGMLSDVTEQESETLGAIKYQPNTVVLHSDESLMPRRRKVWSSWIYSEDRGKSDGRIDLSYWMNSLQPWLTGRNYFVTLNSTRKIREDLIWDEATFHHPVYDTAAIAAQKKIETFNGNNNTWFCGAWMRNGFHEDGLASAVAVVEGMKRASSVVLAAE